MKKRINKSVSFIIIICLLFFFSSCALTTNSNESTTTTHSTTKQEDKITLSLDVLAVNQILVQNNINSNKLETASIDDSEDILSLINLVNGDYYPYDESMGNLNTKEYYITIHLRHTGMYDWHDYEYLQLVNDEYLCLSKYSQNSKKTISYYKEVDSTLIKEIFDKEYEKENDYSFLVTQSEDGVVVNESITIGENTISLLAKCQITQDDINYVRYAQELDGQELKNYFLNHFVGISMNRLEDNSLFQQKTEADINCLKFQIVSEPTFNLIVFSDGSLSLDFVAYNNKYIFMSEPETLDIGTLKEELNLIETNPDYYISFEDDIVFIVLTHEASCVLKWYSIDDFSEINCDSIVELTQQFTEKMMNGEMDEALLSKFQRVLKIKLKVHSKEYVLEAISLLLERDDVEDAKPLYLYTGTQSPQ